MADDDFFNPTPPKAGKITVNLTERSATALDEATELTGDTQADTINRAIQVYAYLEQAQHKGERLFIEAPNGDRERLRFF